ncbi:MAG: acetyl-CoA decarbonylase/synthase complex subunit gamma [Thermoanaerobacterales bacterium]|nr:acetyl-CoA decarbonylase/synthase complex subunit gamma [Bacillota bacterium]MDI6906646.1 acetyl-CoA decarbonylase/synthase complex subunit gamma [Thermoanaerobacterales bacterium]
MALTGLQIFKLLPRTNCRECGQATCLAFAMQLAAGRASLDLCPHAGPEVRDALSAATEPPIALVRIGGGERAVEIGHETVLFRHEKRFVRPTAIAVTVSDRLGPDDVAARVRAIDNLSFERVGQVVGVDLAAIRHETDRVEDFAAAVRAARKHSRLALALLAPGDPAALEAGLEAAGVDRPLVYAATEADWDEVTRLAMRFKAPLAVYADGLDNLASLVEKVAGLGHRELVLDPGGRTAGRVVAEQTLIRRLAVERRFRPFGYPTVCFAGDADRIDQIMAATVQIAKYAAVTVLNTADPADVLPLVTWRLNLYTDPQKPIAIEAGVYEVGRPGPDAPVFLTTNFSLTYFCVIGDIEASRTDAFVLPVDTDGTSVLTAWAAGKLSPERITAFLEQSGIGERVNHRRLIIPGGLAALRDKLEQVSGWEVLIGPRESSAIPAFLRTRRPGQARREEG